MSRRRPPRPDRHRPVFGSDRQETWSDEDYVVRPLTGSASTRLYRCPGCDHEIRPATPHVVVWAVADIDADHRRHWHTACWRARERIAPVRRRA
ncbi:MAG TPA: hypothetical protein VGH85_09235 [Mycobacteriales bacterium]